MPDLVPHELIQAVISRDASVLDERQVQGVDLLALARVLHSCTSFAFIALDNKVKRDKQDDAHRKIRLVIHGN